MPIGWKPDRLKSRPQHVHEKRATVDGDVMVQAPAQPPVAVVAEGKADPTPTRKQLLRIAERRINEKRKSTGAVSTVTPDQIKSATRGQGPEKSTAAPRASDRPLRGKALSKDLAVALSPSGTVDHPKRGRGRPPGPIPFDKKAHDRKMSAERRAKLKAQKESVK